jgi:hypothetical protein
MFPRIFYDHDKRELLYKSAEQLQSKTDQQTKGDQPTGSLTYIVKQRLHINPNQTMQTKESVKNMAKQKSKRYEPKRIFLETLLGYIEAAKCRTLDNFTEVKTQ